MNEQKIAARYFPDYGYVVDEFNGRYFGNRLFHTTNCDILYSWLFQNGYSKKEVYLDINFKIK